MSKETSFKRVALAVIAALGFGLLTSVSPVNALTSETLTVGTPSASTASNNETITVLLDVTFIPDSNSESVLVTVQGLTDGTGFTNFRIQALTTDSQNVTSHGPENTANSGIGGLAANTGDTVVATSAGTYTRAKFNLVMYKAVATSTDQVLTGTVTLKNGATGAILKSSVVSVTVSAPNTTATAANSKLYLNGGQNVGTNATEGDSTIVTTRGTVGSYTAVGYLWPLLLNSAETKTVSGGTVGDLESITVTLSGPGALALSSPGKTEGAKLKSVTVGKGETIVVYNDGTEGTATLRGAIGSTFLTQASKTIKFVGPATTFTAALETSTVTRGAIAYDVVTFTAADSSGNAITTVNQGTGYPGGFYAISSDSGVAGSSLTKASSLRYVACDYNSTRAKWVCDLAAADSGTATIQIGDSLTVATSSATSSALTLTVAGTGNTGTITLPNASYNVGDKAIFTVTSKDGNGRNVADGTSTPFSSLRWGSQTPTFGVPTGSDATGGNIGTNGLISYLDGGGSYVAGVDTLVVYMPTVVGTYTLYGKTGGATAESVLLELKVVDPVQAEQSAAIAAAQAATVAAAKAAEDAAVAAAKASQDAAVAAAKASQDAAVAAAEKAAKEAVAAAKAAEDAAVAAAEKASKEAVAAANAATAAANAATAAAKAAQDAAVAEAQAATDAAAEAIDAANAATDAGNLAAEAADAATVAAEEARDAADSATAAVEELATQVATLMAALKAQITTLANTVAKIAKKVKA